MTPRYAAFGRRKYAAQAAPSAVVCRDPRMADAKPGSFEACQWRPSHRVGRIWQT